MYQDHCYFHCCAGVPITPARHSAETCFFCTHLMESFLANEFYENHSITPLVLRRGREGDPSKTTPLSGPISV